MKKESIEAKKALRNISAEKGNQASADRR